MSTTTVGDQTSRYPRVTPELWARQLPARAELVHRNTCPCFYLVSACGSRLTYRGMRKQVVGLPPWVVMLLGAEVFDADLDENVLDEVWKRENRRAFVNRTSNVLSNSTSSSKLRAFDIDLVQENVRPEDLHGEARSTYLARLQLIAMHGTLGSPVAGSPDPLIAARRRLFDADEALRVEELIAKAVEHDREERKRQEEWDSIARGAA